MVQSFLRALKVRLDRVNNISVGAKVDSRAWICGSKLETGLRVAEGCKIYRATLSGQIEVGRFTSLWGPSIFVSGGIHGVTIGSFCSIAHHVSIQEDFHNIQRTTTYFFERNLLQSLDLDGERISRGPVRIGHDVWMGAGAQVMSGVTIGNGAVIGAGAIVTRDVAPYAVVVGNPARTVRYRFDSETIGRLSELEWWNWSEEQLRLEARFLTQTHDRPS